MFITLERRSNGSCRGTDKLIHVGIQGTVEELALQRRAALSPLRGEVRGKGMCSLCLCRWEVQGALSSFCRTSASRWNPE